MGESRRARLPWLCVALALVPLVYLALDLRLCTIDLPLWDSWELVPLLQKDAAGAVSWSDIWAQHNQHRLVFPRLVLLGLARASGWSVGWEIAFQVLQASLAFVALAWAARALLRETGDSERWPAFAALPILSLLVFSQTQWENWICGWQIQIWMSTGAACGGLLLLARAEWHPARVVAGLALGVVATFSFATGILFWPVGAGALLLTRGPGRSVVRRLALFGIVGALALGAYFTGFETFTPGSSRLGGSWDAATLAAFFLKYLGKAVASRDQRLAMALGALGLSLLAVVPALLVRRRGVPLAAVAPFVAIGAFAVLSGLLVATGRAGFGSKMGMESRFVTLSTPLWCANVVLLLALARAPAPEGDRRLGRAAAVLLAGIVLAAAQSAFREARELRKRDADDFEPARPLVLGREPVDLAKLQCLYTPYLLDPKTGIPTPAFGHLWQRIEWMRDHRVSAFRP